MRGPRSFTFPSFVPFSFISMKSERAWVPLLPRRLVDHSRMFEMKFENFVCYPILNILFPFLLFSANKTNSFIRFWRESTARPNCFGFYLTFKYITLFQIFFRYCCLDMNFFGFSVMNLYFLSLFKDTASDARNRYIYIWSNF